MGDLLRAVCEEIWRLANPLAQKPNRLEEALRANRLVRRIALHYSCRALAMVGANATSGLRGLCSLWRWSGLSTWRFQCAVAAQPWTSTPGDLEGVRLGRCRHPGLAHLGMANAEVARGAVVGCAVGGLVDVVAGPGRGKARATAPP